MNLYCTCRCSSFLFVHMIFWLLILIAHCIFKKVLQHFVVSAISATMMLLVVKKLWNKQIPIKTFPVHALLSLVQDRSRWKRNYSFLVACCFVQTKKINPSVIYRKASSDQEVWWERAIWAISDPGKDFDAGKLHSSMWKLFHMEESASAASVFLFTRCEKENGRRDARSSSSFGTTLCDWAPAGKSKSSLSATLCKRSQLVLAHSAQHTEHGAQFTRST